LCTAQDLQQAFFFFLLAERWLFIEASSEKA